jgi:hypothetical protein
MGPSLHQATTMRGVICGLWVRLCFITFAKKERGFPWLLGDPHGCPDTFNKL